MRPTTFGIHDLALNRLSALLCRACPVGLFPFIGLGFDIADDIHRIFDLAVVRMSWFEHQLQPNPPLLAVEVASGNTDAVDRKAKKREYAKFGVETYWLVSPSIHKPSLTVFDLRRNRYIQVAHVEGTEPYHATRPFPVTVVPRVLISETEEWRSLLTDPADPFDPFA